MMFEKGQIYLANLYPKKGAEVGKTRPVLIFQTDMLNTINHPTVTVLPLTTNLTDNAYPLRYRLRQQDNLQHDSEILCDQIRTIDTRRIIPQVLTTLTAWQLEEVNLQMKIILQLD